MAKDRANRTRKNELKIYLSDNEKYILDRKVELSTTLPVRRDLGLPIWQIPSIRSVSYTHLTLPTT